MCRYQPTGPGLTGRRTRPRLSTRPPFRIALLLVALCKSSGQIRTGSSAPQALDGRQGVTVPSAPHVTYGMVASLGEHDLAQAQGQPPDTDSGTLNQSRSRRAAEYTSSRIVTRQLPTSP